MRKAELTRRTAETDITLSLELDGSGVSQIDTGCGFLDHMLTLFARHGRFDLTVTCKGDTWVDNHHTVEDIGICLGDAFAQALGDKRGIVRYGSCYGLDIPTQKVGTFDTELTKEFLLAFARRSDMTVHVTQLAGENSHHIIEGAFKSLARSLGAAVAIDPRFSQEIPSTKGVL